MTVQWIDGEPNVPTISDTELGVWMEEFTPLILKDGKLYTFKPVDPRTVAFTWGPKKLKNIKKKKKKFKELRVVETDHRCGYVGFFKPSIAEVLAQIPGDLSEKANAFYIDIDTIECYNSGGGHRVRTVFGRLK